VPVVPLDRGDVTLPPRVILGPWPGLPTTAFQPVQGVDDRLLGRSLSSEASINKVTADPRTWGVEGQHVPSVGIWPETFPA
jgi:hypothetical protein